MIDFDFISPTRIIFGKKKEQLIGEVLKEYGYHKILLVYGGESIKRIGLYDTVISKLEENGIEYYELSGITPNPDVGFVHKGLAIIREKPVDALLSIGGGSVIDVSKSICDSYFYDGDPLDFNKKKAVPTKSLPLGVILTIASAGSETSSSCVISDHKSGFKGGFNSDVHRCKFVIENPELTYSVSRYQTGAGVIDIMMHSLERYFGPSSDNELCDDWSLSLCRNVVLAAKKVNLDPRDYEARAQLMLASSLSHSDLTNIGKEKQPFAVHALEHALSGYNPSITHGAGIGVCYLGWARYVYSKDLSKFARLARILFNIDEPNDEKAAIIGINEMEKFYLLLGMPTKLSEFGIRESDLPTLINLASGNGTRVIGRCPQSLDMKDIEAIYKLCL